jgi:hypothetical protein
MSETNAVCAKKIRKSENHFIMAPKVEIVPVPTPVINQQYYVPTVSYPSYTYSHFPSNSSMPTQSMDRKHLCVPSYYGGYYYSSKQNNNAIYSVGRQQQYPETQQHYSIGCQQQNLETHQNTQDKSSELKNKQQKQQTEVCCLPYQEYLKKKTKGRPPHCPVKCRHIFKHKYNYY